MDKKERNEKWIDKIVNMKSKRQMAFQIKSLLEANIDECRALPQDDRIRIIFDCPYYDTEGIVQYIANNIVSVMCYNGQEYLFHRNNLCRI